MSASWRGGSTRRWRKIRAAVLQANLTRNGGVCQLAHPGICEVRADQVHHTQGRSVSGDDHRYLMATCGPCNRREGDPTATPDPHTPLHHRW